MHTRTDDTRIDAGAATLWASAMLILALVIIQAGRLGAGAQAMAEVSEVGDTIIATAQVDVGEDVFAVLDSRAEKLLLYSVVNRNSIELRETVDLPQLFAEARDGGGRR